MEVHTLPAIGQPTAAELARSEDSDKPFSLLVSRQALAAVRGEGLMMGLKMRVPNTEFVAALLRHRMLVIGADNAGAQPSGDARRDTSVRSGAG